MSNGYNQPTVVMYIKGPGRLSLSHRHSHPPNPIPSLSFPITMHTISISSFCSKPTTDQISFGKICQILRGDDADAAAAVQCDQIGLF